MSPERPIRWLLRLLPFDLRTDHGPEMEQVFREEHREARRQGRGEVLAVWWRALTDIARTAPREHAAQLVQDAGYALRMMRRSPGFTAVAVVTLALGIGVNSAVFSLVHAVLRRPLPYGDPDRLVALANRWDGNAAAGLSDPELMDYQERSRTLQIAASAFSAVNLGAVGEPERLAAAAVTTNLLPVLGVAPALGRNFLPGEEREGSGRVAILTHGLWVRRFDADPAVLGRTIHVNGEPFEIVGVTPAGLLLPSDFRGGAAEMLVPLSLDRAAARNRRGGHYLQSVARLAPGVSLDAARAEIGVVVSGLIQEYPDQHKQGHWFVVTPGYFEALGVRLVSGRFPAEEDDERGSVLFLNESAARTLFPGEDPVGHRARLSRTTGDEQPWRTIAGVVADVRQRGLERPPRPEMYIPLPQFRHFLARTQAWSMVVVAKASVPPLSLAGPMRAAARRVDPEVPVASVHAMDEVVGASMADRRRDAWLIGAFAALALVVASIGVYGVTAYHVARRRREIGLRVALGAERRDVVRMVLGQGLRLVGFGIGAGVPAARLAAGALQSLLFEVTPHDVSVFAAIPMLLLTVAVLACAVPAARAARIDAAVALREE